MPHYSLRFISGKYQGGEFPLRLGREIVFGRSNELDVVLVEDMVSRKHAKITTVDGQLTISDLGSTNGTFVNGERIKKIALKGGDRILLGTSIMKLIVLDEEEATSPVSSEAEARKQLETKGARRAARPMSGTIDEIPLLDVLQLLSSSRKDGVLALRSDAVLGKIYFRKGSIYYASIDDNFSMRAEKALYRLLTWTQGTFELEPADDRQVMDEISAPTEFLIMEGVRHIDEIKRLEAELPGQRFKVVLPLAERLRDLSPEALDVFQLVLDHGSLQVVLDQHAGADLDAYLQIVDLVKRKLIVAS